MSQAPWLRAPPAQAFAPGSQMPTPTPTPTPPYVSAALIRLDDVSLRFGERLALRHINLQIHRGDRIALVGANGAGKTSLLRLLNGLVAPSSGQRRWLPPHVAETGVAGVASVAGAAVLAAQPAGRAPVTAMLFQRPFLLHFSVRRNLQLALWLAGVPAALRASRLYEGLQRVGLLALAERPARALSGGQQQRLALARAWAVQPDMLFLDEPTASLDPTARREVEALIDEFGHAGMTLVMSTHNLGQAKRLTRRVFYLDAGRLLADLPVDDFFKRQDLPPEAALFLKGELPWT